MQQYFAKNKSLELEDSDYHHIKNVMRMKKNDIINVVFDNVIYTCKLNEVSNNVTFRVINKEEKEIEKCKVDVAFSLIKEQKLNYLLQKTTELGVNNLIPLNTKRSIIKIDSKKENSKIERWQKICKEASEQSFRSDVPLVCNILSLEDLIKKDYDIKILCSLNENTKKIKKVLQNMSNYGTMLIVTGPEGGFEKSEEEMLINSGFISVSLGSTVLRAETAPVVALSMINYENMR